MCLDFDKIKFEILREVKLRNHQAFSHLQHTLKYPIGLTQNQNFKKKIKKKTEKEIWEKVKLKENKH